MLLPRSLLELRAALRAGSIDPEHVVRASLASVAMTNPRLGAFVDVHEQEAIHAARLFKEAGVAGNGPLAGIPVAVKDNIAEAGVVCAAGSNAYADRVAPADAEVVRRLRKAGAVILGRTAMDELGDHTTGETCLKGPVHNPWRHGYRAGGSSAGSAAAVCAGLAAAALGTDTAGSSRIPAALCGVVGFKPSFGLLPVEGIVPLSPSLDHVGIIARSVPDVAAVLDALVPKGYLDACLRWAGRLRIGILRPWTEEPEDEVMQVIGEALPLFEKAGFVLQDAACEGLQGARRTMGKVYRPEAVKVHAATLQERPDAFGALVRADLERGLRQTEAEYQEGLREREEIRKAVLAVSETFDILVSPTTPHRARPVGSEGATALLTYTVPFNLTGQPALTLPVGLHDGLPVGLQLVGRLGEETRLLAVAAALERRLGFSGAVPE